MVILRLAAHHGKSIKKNVRKFAILKLEVNNVEP